jgi:hypothetical protein
MTTDPLPRPPALDYAARPGAGRRALRRARRWWPIGLVLAVGALGAVYGPGAWRNAQLMRVQSACASAVLTAAADRPIDADPDRARALCAARPDEYRLTGPKREVAMRTDPRWTALATALGLPSPATAAGGRSTTYVGERFTPDGRRRIVVIEDVVGVTLIEPGTLTRPPRVISTDAVALPDNRSLEDGGNAGLYLELPLAMYWNPDLAIGPGAPDPADRSRVTVPIALGGTATGAFDYTLLDSDKVLLELRDAAGFDRRMAEARKAHRASRATPPGRE